MKILRSRWSLLAGGSLLLLALACRSEAPPEPVVEAEVPAEPVPGGTLVVGYGADVEGFNPVVQGSDLEGQLLDHMFPLLAMPVFDGVLTYEPHLARSWEFSDDGLSLTFHLRDDLLWSDGAPITASDVVFTLELIRDPDVGSAYHGQLEHLRVDDPLEEIDAHTVAVHFDHAYDRGSMLSHAASCSIVPRHALADVPRDQLRGVAAQGTQVSAGPFRLERWERNQQVVLVRDDAWPLPHPAYLDRVVVRVIPEYTTRLIELRNGNLDMLPGLQVEDVEPLRREHPEIRVVGRGYRYLDYIAWNTADARFADARVRTALAHAIDVDALIATLLGADGRLHGRRAVGTVSPELAGVGEPDIEPLAFDPDRARALLAEAGWSDTDGDGWVDLDGEPFRFELRTNSGNPRRERAQLIVQEQLRAVGVDARPSTLEGNAFYDSLRERDFEAALAGWGSSLFVDPSRKWRSDGVYNYPSYRDDAVDDRVDRGLSTVDPAEAARCWRELQQIVYRDQPYCFLYWREELVAVHDRFVDVGIDTLWLFDRLPRWWVPADRQRPRR